jgi:hypothetical protein
MIFKVLMVLSFNITRMDSVTLTRWTEVRKVGIGHIRRPYASTVET